MAYYLGIDGGGTRTTCIVGDETRELARAEGSASNVIRVGEASAREALRAVTREVCTKAGVDPSSITRTVAGIAGSGNPEIRQVLVQTLREAVGGEVRVVGDSDLALYAAFGDAPGVIVIAGTGSIALAQGGGQDGERKTARAGGWGWAISDEGSGPWIGRAAVAAIFRARDAGVPTTLEQRVLDRWHMPDIHQLVRRANSAPQPNFGELLTDVVDVANAGDAAAAAILARTGGELALLAKIAAESIFLSNTATQVAMSGGVFAHAPNVREAFYHSLQKLLPQATLQMELCDPALGALQWARRG